ncbi:MAG: DUF4337 family protein [Dehalococcoidia bacterium]
METREAIERAHEAHKVGRDGAISEKIGAVTVAILAAILALAAVFGRRSVAELLLAQEQSSNAATVAETNSIKERINQNTLLLLSVWGADPDTQAAADEAIATLQRDIAQTFHPEEQRQAELAKQLQEERNTAQRRYESFELSETASQLAVVFATIAIVASSLRLFWVAGGLGLIGLILLIDGFVTVLPFPH